MSRTKPFYGIIFSLFIYLQKNKTVGARGYCDQQLGFIGRTGQSRLNLICTHAFIYAGSACRWSRLQYNFRQDILMQMEESSSDCFYVKYYWLFRTTRHVKSLTWSRWQRGHCEHSQICETITLWAIFVVASGQALGGWLWAQTRCSSCYTMGMPSVPSRFPSKGYPQGPRQVVLWLTWIFYCFALLLL